MRGHFAIGIEGVSKPMNVGNLVRSAHAFGAAFVFTVAAHPRTREAPSDTSNASDNLPVYRWASIAEMALPSGCTLVAVELTDDAIELPSYRHPRRATYVLGPERGSISPAMRALCSCHKDTHVFLHQRGDSQRHRHIRSLSASRWFSGASGDAWWSGGAG